MLRATTVATLLACLTFTAGCSGSDPDLKAALAGTPGATDAAVVAVAGEGPSPLTGMTAQEVLEKTKADADSSTSVHVAGRVLDGAQRVAFNVKITDAGKSFGVVVLDGRHRVTLRRLGRTLYFRADRAYWTSRGAGAAAAARAGRWVKVQRGFSADSELLFQLTDMDLLVADLMSLSVGEQQALKLVPGIRIARQPTVGLVDASGAEAVQYQTLYVAAADPALPLHFMVGAGASRYLKFRSWNKDFVVVPPRDALALTKAR